MSRIAIIDAGAIGSALGGFLQRADEDVTLIGRHEQVITIRQRGLRVEGAWGSFIFMARIPTADKLDFRPDFAFLTFKT